MNDGNNLNRIIEKYVRLLREMSPDREDIEQHAAELLADYEQELLQAEAKPDFIKSGKRFSFLCLKAEMQIAQAENLQVLSTVVTNHMRVENALFRHLKARLALLPQDKADEQARILAEAEEQASLSRYLIILKGIPRKSTDFSRGLFSGLTEVDALRKKFSHDLTYALRPDDIQSQLKVLELAERTASAMEPIDAYVQFCNFCSDFFKADSWGTGEVQRKVMKLPEQQPDWREFARRYSLP